MKKTVTRRLVIDAIRKEKLRGDTYFHDVNDPKDALTCQVCAVGAVLRRASFVKWWIDKQPFKYVYNLGCSAVGGYSGITRDDGIEQAIIAKMYLNALSRKFETMVEKRKDNQPTKKDRETLIEWVKKNLPKKFVVSI